MRKLKRLSAVISLALVSMAAISSTAAAEGGVPQWSTIGTKAMKWSGSLTFKKAGGSPVSCTFNQNGTTGAAGAFDMVVSLPFGTCAGGTKIQWWQEGSAIEPLAGKFSLEFSDYALGWHSSPWSGLNWAGGEVTVPFTNGSGATPSKITFSETKVGITELGQTVTATGQLNVTNASTGKALTLK